MKITETFFYILFIVGASVLAFYEWLYLRAVNRSRIEVGINPAHILSKMLKLSLYLALATIFLSIITLLVSLLLNRPRFN